MFHDRNELSAQLSFCGKVLSPGSLLQNDTSWTILWVCLVCSVWSFDWSWTVLVLCIYCPLCRENSFLWSYSWLKIAVLATFIDLRTENTWSILSCSNVLESKALEISRVHLQHMFKLLSSKTMQKKNCIIINSLKDANMSDTGGTIITCSI